MKCLYSTINHIVNKVKSYENQLPEKKISESTRRHLRRKRAKQRKKLQLTGSDLPKTESSTYDYNPLALKNIKKILDLQECLANTVKTKDCEVANLLANSKNQELVPCNHILNISIEENVNGVDSEKDSSTHNLVTSNSNEIVKNISNDNTSAEICIMYSKPKSNTTLNNIETETKMCEANNISTIDTITSEIDSNNIISLKMPQQLSELPTESKKSREEILAERKAKKLAKKSTTKTKETSQMENIQMKINITLENTTNSKHTQNMPDLESKQTPNKENHIVVPLDKQNNIFKTALKSKSELKAERRAKQEQQRAAKTTTLVDKSKPIDSSSKTDKNDLKQINKTDNTPIKLTSEQTGINVQSAVTANKLIKSLNQHKVQLFNHLYIERTVDDVLDKSLLHASILKLGVQYATRVILGSSSRCIAMLNAIQDVIRAHQTPANEEFGRSLDTVLKKNIEYLQSCRPLSVSMTNSIRGLKYQVTQLPNNIQDDKAKETLLDFINEFIREQIGMAIEAISITVQPKIANGDVILTYGCSSLIENILSNAHTSGKLFRVVVVDGRPLLEGREMLRRLVSIGIKCTYVMITAMNFIMPEVSKVLLGAHALLANGYVMSRAGTAQVALMANARNIPVLVCCETLKFSERVQTDSIVYNEIGEPELLIAPEGNILSNWKSTSAIPLNLTYDVTPPDLVTAVVTEIAILPCTSVPVILRIKPADSSIIYS